MLIKRLLMALVHILLWFGLWFSLLVITVALVFQFRDASWLRNMPDAWRPLAEVVVRMMVFVPFLTWILLIIHPIRMRWWLARLPVRLWRRLRRGNPSLPHPSVPASETSPQPVKWMPQAPKPMSRRRFLTESALTGGIVGYAMFVEPYLLQVREVDLVVRNLPERFRGYRIAQMSDLHINAYTTGLELQQAVEHINRLGPDLVTITGDFVDWNADYADEATRPFRAIQAPDGVISILGNHDYYSGRVEAIKQAIQRHDLGLLVNQHTVLRRGADSLALIGLDDPRHGSGGGRYNYESIDPDRALIGLQPSIPRILLVHNPVIAPWLMRNYDLDVILSGHTHGGQFQVPILTETLIGAREYFVQGHYNMGRTQVYVNRGFGFTGPPVRFRTRPEVTLIRLVASS